MGKCYIQNAQIVNENEIFTGDILIIGNLIAKISRVPLATESGCTTVDARGKYVIPGIIDDQVHFREPGLTHKGDIATESKAAIAGGVTSFMEMPNTNPQTINITELEKKFDIAAKSSFANYSFYLGATNDNISEIRKIKGSEVCGLKVFMGSSTGNMLVDQADKLEQIFAESPVIITTHCEDETIVQNNSRLYREQYGDEVPFRFHPEIRSAEACYVSSALAVKLAGKYQSRLHILHVSTGKELELFDNNKPLKDKRITSEVCIHHLWFSDRDYERKGSLIKWNPAIKTESDRKALFAGLLSDKLDVIATDHAPHTLEEKAGTYFKAPSGGPMVQHSLNAMLEFVRKGQITIKKVVEKMCHAPAIVFGVKNRGFIREGYYADLVIIDPDTPHEINYNNIHYKCKWSPLEGEIMHAEVTHTFINGELVYCRGEFNEKKVAMRLVFER